MLTTIKKAEKKKHMQNMRPTTASANYSIYSVFMAHSASKTWHNYKSIWGWIAGRVLKTF